MHYDVEDPNERTTMTTFDLAIAQSLYDSNDRFPVDFDDAWVWCGYSNKANALKKLIAIGFDEGTDFTVHHFGGTEALDVSAFEAYQRKDKYHLSIDCFKSYGMMAQTEAGKQVRRYFLQCEKLAKESTQTIAALQSQVKGLNALLQAKPKTVVQREVVKRVAPADTVQKFRCEASRVWADFGPHDPVVAKSIVAGLMAATDKFLQEYCDEKLEIAVIKVATAIEKAPEIYATPADHLTALGFSNPKQLSARVAKTAKAYCKREGLAIIKRPSTNKGAFNKYPLSSILFAVALKGLKVEGASNA